MPGDCQLVPVVIRLVGTLDRNAQVVGLFFGELGQIHSQLADVQAGVDAGWWTLWTALAGANLVHDVGYVDSGLTCSYEMIVICDEAIGFVRRLLEGMEVSPETLALDVIDKVGLFVLMGLGLNIVVAMPACSTWATWPFTPSAHTPWPC